MAVIRLSSADSGYLLGDLSIYKNSIDTYDTLFQATNNASTKLGQAISVTSDVIVVEDTSKFPSSGILRIFKSDYTGLSSELVFYSNKTENSFYNLDRGFAGTKINEWKYGTTIEAGVMAEHHNSTRDAIFNIQSYLGTNQTTDENTLNGLLKKQESKIYSPRSLFRAFPRTGNFPLTVNFHTFTNSNTIRYFWDFGDGSTLSFEKNPVHVYKTEGSYTVTLRTITQLGAQGFTTKTNYVEVYNDYATPFVYATPKQGISTKTAASSGNSPTTFLFVDQTRAEIVSRLWQFGDGNSQFITDPNQHTVTYQYENNGTYRPSVLIELKGQKVITVFLNGSGTENNTEYAFDKIEVS
jgi:PKD repeat protein